MLRTLPVLQYGLHQEALNQFESLKTNSGEKSASMNEAECQVKSLEFKVGEQLNSIEFNRIQSVN